ncbi:MAG: hypothetical protein ACQEXJ_20895 [Myxococcota bacterium]
MIKPITLILLLAALLAPAALATPPPADGDDIRALWERVDRMEADIADHEARARRDIRRGLNKAALHRYQEIIADVQVEMGLLGDLYDLERDLERQTEILTRQGTARERLERARDIVSVLRATTRR